MNHGSVGGKNLVGRTRPTGEQFDLIQGKPVRFQLTNCMGRQLGIGVQKGFCLGIDGIVTRFDLIVKQGHPLGDLMFPAQDGDVTVHRFVRHGISGKECTAIRNVDRLHLYPPFPLPI